MVQSLQTETFWTSYLSFFWSVACICMSMWVGFCVVLAPDQCSPASASLLCNYTAVCDIWAFKRLNTVSLLSQGRDIRRVNHHCKRSLAVFWCLTTAFFFSSCFSSYLLSMTFMYGDGVSQMSLLLRGDYWAEDSRRHRSERWDTHQQAIKKGRKPRSNGSIAKIPQLGWMHNVCTIGIKRWMLHLYFPPLYKNLSYNIPEFAFISVIIY